MKQNFYNDDKAKNQKSSALDQLFKRVNDATPMESEFWKLVKKVAMVAGLRSLTYNALKCGSDYFSGGEATNDMILKEVREVTRILGDMASGSSTKGVDELAQKVDAVAADLVASNSSTKNGLAEVKVLAQKFDALAADNTKLNTEVVALKQSIAQRPSIVAYPL
ncbi:uncharacterized protein LOC113309134 [Papaver somniferum]|uniref:uncharacterized protein LOC113309134 n=1 Tax=Papaver somniferum TaxID=3469 RepID=UPI000E6FD7B9|nr:uncharacterized protein LOC113309134 [Papaver somniferum]